MKRCAFSILLISMFCVVSLQAQDKSNRGKEFWLAYGFDYSFFNESPVNNQEAGYLYQHPAAGSHRNSKRYQYRLYTNPEYSGFYSRCFNPDP